MDNQNYWNGEERRKPSADEQAACPEPAEEAVAEKRHVTESIWDGHVVVPLADVQHIEKLTHPTIGKNGLWVITKHTRYNMEADIWDNPIYIQQSSAESFLKAWCQYRHELEKDTLMVMP